MSRSYEEALQQWRHADQDAAKVERRICAKVLAHAGNRGALPSREELAHAEQLRHRSTLLFDIAMHSCGRAAESLSWRHCHLPG